MATKSSSQLKSVPGKRKKYFTEQYEEYFSSQETDDNFLRKMQKEIMESNRKSSSSSASCEGVSLCLCLSLLPFLLLHHFVSN